MQVARLTMGTAQPGTMPKRGTMASLAPEPGHGQHAGMDKLAAWFDRPGAWIAGAARKGSGAQWTAQQPASGLAAWAGATAGAGEVAAAVAAAGAAAPGWRRTPLAERAAVLEQFALRVRARAGELAALISAETGKPAWEAAQEVAATAAKIALAIRAQAERAGEPATGPGPGRTRFRPLGVVGVLGPFNFPAHLPNGHLAPALLAGNTAVLKPSEHTGATALLMAELWAEAGLPAGVLNVVLGGRETGSALTAQPGLDGLFFTGSAQVGRALHRQFGGRPEVLLALEMGGNNPLVVDRVADVDAAVNTILQSAYLTAGQRCTCARRLILVDGACPPDLLERLAAAVPEIRVGPPELDPPAFHGPVITAAAADRVVAGAAQLEALGVRTLVPVRRGDPATGFVTPGLVDATGVPADRLPDEEVFGPLLTVRRVPDFAAALVEANRTAYGLAAGLLGGDRAQWETFQDTVRAGVMNWNQPLPGASSAAPFGGRGASGNHRPSAFFAVDYCNVPVASLEQETLVPGNVPPGLRG